MLHIDTVTIADVAEKTHKEVVGDAHVPHRCPTADRPQNR
jgi:hypothetical protein